MIKIKQRQTHISYTKPDEKKDFPVGTTWIDTNKNKYYLCVRNLDGITTWLPDPYNTVLVPIEMYTMMGIFGGTDYNGELATNQRYTKATDSWILYSPLSSAKSVGGSGSISSKTYIVGGKLNDVCQNTNIEYAYSNDSYTTKTVFPSPTRFGQASTAISGSVYNFGGNDNNGTSYADNDAFEPLSNTWIAKTNLVSPERYVFGGVMLNDLGYVFGGASTSYTPYSDIDMFSPITNSWTSQIDGSYASIYTGGVNISGKAYFFNGYTNSVIQNYTMEFNPVLNSTTIKTAPPLPARYGCACPSLSNTGYAMGGYPGSINATRDNDEYTVDTWVSKADLNTAVFVAFSGWAK